MDSFTSNRLSAPLKQNSALIFKPKRWMSANSFCHLQIEQVNCFVQLGLNEADRIKSNSVLIHSSVEHIVYTRMGMAWCRKKFNGINRVGHIQKGRGSKHVSYIKLHLRESNKNFGTYTTTGIFPAPPIFQWF